jgi:hypothetical protein
LAAHKKAQEAYTAPTKEPEVAITDEVRRQNWLDKQALAQSQSPTVAVSPALHGQSVGKEKQVVSEELQKEAPRVGGRIDPTLKPKEQSQRQTPSEKVQKTKSGREVN